MGRIITLSMALVVTIGGTGVALAQTYGHHGPQAAQPARYVVRDDFGGRRSFVPPRYGRRRGMPPNPDAPAWSQLDPGLYYAGP
jgi:hypothetical protein